MAAGRLKSVAGRKWLALKPDRDRPIPHRTSQTSRFPPMKKAALIILLSTATALAGPVACSSGTDSSSATYTLGTELGINKAAMDTSVKPGNDFYAYANGNWQKTTEIPADRDDRKSTRLNSSH